MCMDLREGKGQREMKTIYMECTSGISGDMTVGALLDLGANADGLQRVLEMLPVEGYTVKISRVRKSGIDACDFAVLLDDVHENHDHDMEYLHGHSHSHTHDGEEEHTHSHAHEGGERTHSHAHHDEEGHMHAHTHDGGEAHAHSHTHENAEGHTHAHIHTHEHRGLAEILHIISQAQMSHRAKGYAEKIFKVIGAAEAKAHGIPEEQVHFHEVGAVDSIVDIIAIAYCLDDLDIGEVIVPKLWEGTGTVRCQHGVLPVPVPAVANIVSAYKLPLHIMDTAGEFVTPTGAAVVAAICTNFQLPETFTVKRMGIGAGKRNYERPSLLRIMEIEITVDGDSDIGENTGDGIGVTSNLEADIYKLETNIDDCSGENLGYVMDKLFDAGARDVEYVPVYMKKNRPAYQLNIICSREDVPKMEKIVFAETTTIGIRKYPVMRSILERISQRVETPFGFVRVKVCLTPDGNRGYLEYEDVAAVAKNTGMSYPEARAKLQVSCAEKMENIVVI